MMVQEYTLEEQALFAKVKSSDKAAFREMYDRYYRYLVTTANNILGDLDTARDLVQDVFFEVWRRREEIEIRTSLKSYLRRSVVNKTLNHIKSRRLDFDGADHLAESPALGADAQSQLEASDLEKVIYTAIAMLPERCRVIFTLCRLENLSHKEIADQLDISTKTIENQMTRALASLRDAIGPYLTAVFAAWLGGGSYF